MSDNVVSFTLPAGLFHILMVELEFASTVYSRGEGHATANCNLLLKELYRQTGVNAQDFEPAWASRPSPERRGCRIAP